MDRRESREFIGENQHFNPEKNLLAPKRSVSSSDAGWWTRHKPQMPRPRLPFSALRQNPGSSDSGTATAPSPDVTADKKSPSPGKSTLYNELGFSEK